MIIVALVVIAYLLGSIPTSLLVARYAKGIDLRHWGSGNLGATNLYRAAGARYGDSVRDTPINSINPYISAAIIYTCDRNLPIIW